MPLTSRLQQKREGRVEGQRVKREQKMGAIECEREEREVMS